MPHRPRQVTVVVLLLLGAIYISSSLLVPLTIALIAYLALRPIVAQLCSFGLSQTISTAMVIVMRQVFAGFESTFPLAVILGESPCGPGEDCEPVREHERIAEAV